MAMVSPQLNIEQDVIDEFEGILAPVLEEVLGLSPESVLLTDLSDLSDFCPAGLPKEISENCTSHQDYVKAWDLWVVREIARRFDLDESSISPVMRMLDLGQLLKAKSQGVTLH